MPGHSGPRSLRTCRTRPGRVGSGVRYLTYQTAPRRRTTRWTCPLTGGRRTASNAISRPKLPRAWDAACPQPCPRPGHGLLEPTRESPANRVFRGLKNRDRGRCHAEGRGFESLQPLRKGPQKRVFCMSASVLARTSPETVSQTQAFSFVAVRYPRVEASGLRVELCAVAGRGDDGHSVRTAALLAGGSGPAGG